MLIRKFVTAALAAIILPAAANAISFDEVLGAQYVLKRTGFYDAKVDGLMGPATKGALQAYADTKNLNDSNFYTILGSMWSQSISWEEEVPPEAEVELNKTLDNILFDSQSARVKNKRFFLGKGEGYTICVDVKAKNRYGAYVGWETLMIPLLKIGNSYMAYAVWDKEKGAEILCNFGFVFDNIMIGKF